MSALKFLSKKSWHTGLIKNNEKVWLREQAEAKEKQRVAELQKQLEEERRLEEIQRLEIESGRLDPAEVKRRQRIEWMYEDGPTAHSKAAKEQAAREQEDTLLGKKSATLPTGPREKDPEKARLVDVEAKLREDPMLQIEQERRRAIEFARQRQRLNPVSELPKAEQSRIAAKLARRAERREIREIRKRRRQERELMKGNAPRQDAGPSSDVAEAKQSAGASANGLYGLQIPKGGTNVRVKDAFVPKGRGTNPDECSGHHRRRSDFPDSERFDSRHVADANDDEKRKQMREAAERLQQDRRKRVASRSARNARDEYEDEQERMWGANNVIGTQLTSMFAKDALRSDKIGSVGDRIQQRKVRSARDDAGY